MNAVIINNANRCCLRLIKIPLTFLFIILIAELYIKAICPILSQEPLLISVTYFVQITDLILEQTLIGSIARLEIQSTNRKTISHFDCSFIKNYIYVGIIENSYKVNMYMRVFIHQILLDYFIVRKCKCT